MSLQGLRRFFKDKLSLILGVYIVLQPILDIFTALGVKAEFPVTVGVVVRALFMALTFLYVVFICQFPGKKWCLAALGVLLGYLALFMLQLLLIGGLSLCIDNLQETVKTFFAPFVAVFLIAVYKEYGTYVSTRAIAWSCGIYTGVILLAFLTGTSNISYANSGYGYNGWFYAANEISCIVSIAVPALLFYCLKVLPSVTKKTWWKGALILWTLASVVFTADFIGTKAAFGAIALYMIAALIWAVIFQFKAPSRDNLIRIGALAAMAAAVFALYSISSLHDYITNVMDPLMDVPSDEINNIWSSPIAEANVGTWLRELITTNDLVQRIDSILSRRLFSAASSVQVFLDRGLIAKLLGIGYANTPAYGYRVEFMIEMDPLAILVRHGILGFLLYFAPYAAFFVTILRRFFRRPLKALSSLKYCSYLYSCLFALAIALIVGHALVSPSVSIFVLVTAMQLWVVSGQEDPDSLPAAL